MRRVREQPYPLFRWKTLAGALALSSPLLLTALVGYRLFSLHGSIGLYRAVPGVRLAWRGIVLLSLLLPLATLLMLRREYASGARNGRGRAWLVVLAWLLMAAAVLLPTSVYGQITSWKERRCGDKPPLLLITEREGSHGIPDLALVFWTVEDSRNRVEWSKAGCPYRTEMEECPSQTHVFFFRDLEPGSEYYYRINGSDPMYFRAPPSGSEEGLRFAVASDSHFGLEGADRGSIREALDSIDRGEERADLLFIAGDLVDRGYDDRHWQEALAMLGEEIADLPTAIVPGNHDTMLGGVDLFTGYLYPWNHSEKGAPELWRRVDAGDIHFLLLDLEWGAESGPSGQREWLERQLSSIPPEEWTVVISHHYFFSSGGRLKGAMRYDDAQMIEAYVPLFREGGVDLVVSGHNHHLELLEDGGVAYAVVGAMGGKEPGPLERVSPASVWRGGTYRGYLLVEVKEDSLLLDFRGCDGRVLGSFALEGGRVIRLAEEPAAVP